jgi:hypothetical protein
MDSQLDTQDEDVALTADQRGGYQVLSDAAALKQVSVRPGIVCQDCLLACSKSMRPASLCWCAMQALVDEKSAPELLQHKTDLLQSIEQRLAEQVRCMSMGANCMYSGLCGRLRSSPVVDTVAGACHRSSCWLTGKDSRTRLLPRPSSSTICTEVGVQTVLRAWTRSLTCVGVHAGCAKCQL